ncbi:MAG: GTPase ObgE, partial [Lachnospiraceae bacterium]|nr:GTPase ObgE [Lachnospiraceae bacterium]
MFADQARIFIKSGKGGDGHVSFRRELYVAAGGPDGGDGGRGGDIIFEVEKGLNTLGDFRHQRKYVAKDGEPGGKRRMHGKDAEDLVIKVPEGTVIRDEESGKVIADMSGENMRCTVLTGGKGGIGNMHFATSTMQVPKYAKPGQPSKELWVILELKSIADVGLIGFPSVGKSTIISSLSNARPKIAAYHFTTLTPVLGVVEDGGEGFIMADIPGIIEGASEGLGLGHEFLRHVERCKLLLHVVDIAATEGRDPVEDVRIINEELKKFSEKLAGKPQILVANKCDAIVREAGAEDPVERLRKAYETDDLKVFPISAVTKEGTKELLTYVKARLRELPREVEVYEPEFVYETDSDANLPYPVE